MTKAVWSIALAVTALALVSGAAHALAEPGSGLGRFIELEDLLAQKTMADAAKEMTLIAWIQIAVGLGTLAGLAWTLKYTRDTARAGQASADAAEKTLNAVERPYVFLSGVHSIGSQEHMGDWNFFIDYSIANHGKTPAIIESMSGSISFEAEPAEPKEVTHGHTTKIVPIFKSGESRETWFWCPDEHIRFKHVGDGSGDVIEIAHPTTDNFFFRLVVRYKGPFTSEHETSGCWTWNEKEHCLVPYGGEDYNYTR